MFKDVLLVWNQVRDAPGAQEGRPTPDRGIIAEIEARALPVRFADPEAKEAMIGGVMNPFHMGYIVDVKVPSSPRGPSAYLVQRLKDTIPLQSSG